jgi:hypothetical protein
MNEACFQGEKSKTAEFPREIARTREANERASTQETSGF